MKKNWKSEKVGNRKGYQKKQELKKFMKSKKVGTQKK